jgi:hypothetical protein
MTDHHYGDISRESYFIRFLWGQWNRLTIQNGILYRRRDIIGTDLPNLQAVTPLNKGNNKITELRTILQRESKNS